MHNICMNYLNMQRVGHRKGKLNEICILMGEDGGLGAKIQKVLSSFVLEIHPGGATVCCLMSAKQALVSLALQAVPPSLVCALRAKQPSSPAKEASLWLWQEAGVISFSPSGRNISSWPLGGTVVSICKRRCTLSRYITAI